MTNVILKKGVYIIAIIIILTLSVYFYWLYKESKIHYIPTEDLKSKIERLEKDKIKIGKKIDSINSVTNKLYKTIDSFESLKPKIKIKYVEKYRQIDSSNSNYLAKKFDSIFTANNIK